jgi:hypothetical protein
LSFDRGDFGRASIDDGRLIGSGGGGIFVVWWTLMVRFLMDWRFADKSMGDLGGGVGRGRL